MCDNDECESARSPKNQNLRLRYQKVCYALGMAKRKRARKSSPAQRAHRKRFKAAIKACKGSGNFRTCIAKKLKK